MSSYTHVRRYPRFLAYLPVQCTTLNRGRAKARMITGKTKSISPGGLGLLLPDTIPLRTSVSVQVCQEEPLRGHVIWLYGPMSTDLGTRIPHGVAFDQPVDEDRIRQWVLNANHQAHPRVRVQINVEFTGAGKVRHGTCLNLSRGGMFITTMDDSPTPGVVTLLCFELHETSHMLLIPAEVAWMRGEASGPSTVTGMGVKFLEVNPSEDALIGAVVDRLRGEASSSPVSSLPPSP
ncbi:MAG: PilZ domain-containing protein [candidate division NC10 bacterium]